MRKLARAVGLLWGEARRGVKMLESHDFAGGFYEERHGLVE